MNTACLDHLWPRLKPVLPLLPACWLLPALCGCRPEAAPSAEAAPQVSGNQITFATNAPQLGYLNVQPAQPQSATTVGLYGRLAWDDDVTVRVFSPVAGRVLKLPVELNQTVAAGDELAELDSPDFGQALADARTAEGNLVETDKALVRARELFNHGAAAQKDVEAAEAAQIAALAEKDRAEARLANYGGNSQNSTGDDYLLYSPLGGVLVEKNVTPGQEIRSDLMLANATQFTDPQFVVTDPTKLWLFLDVDELSVTSLSVGDDVAIHTAAYPDKTFHAQVNIVGHELDPTTRTIKVRCLVNNADKLLRAEMYVTATVTNNGAAAVQVPSRAVFLKGDTNYVFVEQALGRYERVAVTVGPENSGQVVVLHGLAPDQPIVTQGCLLLESLLEGDNS